MPLLIALIVIGIILLIVGGVVATLKFLIWLGLALVLIGAIVWLLRYIRSRA